MSSRDPNDLAIDIPKLASIPISTTGGFAIPSFLLSLSAPQVVSSDTKQIFIAVWQHFPFVIEVFQQVLPSVMSNVFGIASQSSGKRTNTQSLHALRAVYSILLILAGVSHISTTALVTVSYLFPHLFTPKYRGVFNFANVFQPAAITGFTKMSSVEAGMQQLLQYDFYVGASAILIWATTLWLKTGVKDQSLLRSGICLIGLTAILGPIGAATACIWLRDETVFGEPAKRSKKES